MKTQKYSNEATAVLRIVWEAEDRICSKHLHSFLNDLVALNF